MQSDWSDQLVWLQEYTVTTVWAHNWCSGTQTTTTQQDVFAQTCLDFSHQRSRGAIHCSGERTHVTTHTHTYTHCYTVHCVCAHLRKHAACWLTSAGGLVGEAKCDRLSQHYPPCSRQYQTAHGCVHTQDDHGAAWILSKETVFMKRCIHNATNISLRRSNPLRLPRRGHDRAPSCSGCSSQYWASSRGLPCPPGAGIALSQSHTATSSTVSRARSLAHAQYI